jgi:hypothetical protein
VLRPVHAQFFFDDGDGQRRFFRDVMRHLQGEIFQFLGWNDMVEDPDRHSALGGDGRGGKNQLLNDVEASVAGQVVDAHQVIRARRG